MLQRLVSNKYFDWHRFAGLVERKTGYRRDRSLPWTFALLTFLDLASHQTGLLGVDAKIYYRAAAAFVAGASPWDALAVSPVGNDLHFAALPTTVLALVPFTLIVEQAFVWVCLFASAGAAVWIVRRLNLPWWWVLFPPLAQGVFSANPQVVLLALLLSGSSALASIAPMLKVYAFAPLVGERRVGALLIAALVMAGSWLIAPQLWAEYIGRFSEISDRLMRESWGGYSAMPFYNGTLYIAGIVGVVLLAIVDFRAAGWMAGPALVPASQFHLSTMTLPILARGAPTLLIVALSIPVRGVPPAAIGIYGVWRAYTFVLARRRARTGGRQP